MTGLLYKAPTGGKARACLVQKALRGTDPIRRLALAIILLSAAGVLPAQELFRSAVPRGEDWALREVNLDNQPYTFKQGDFRLLLTPSVEVDWVDNVNLSHDNALSDVIVRPLLQLDGSYVLTHRNLLRFNVGIGYDIYLDHSEFDALRLLSGSQISFDTYIEDFVINVHDRFRYIQDPAEQAAVATTARFGGLYNTAGISATWDQRDLVLGLGYDHDNFISTTSDFSYLNRASELFSGRAGFRVNPSILTGVEANGSLTSYDEHYLNDNSGYSVGPFVEWRPGQYFRVEARVGYAAFLFDQTSTTIRAEDQDAWYGQIIASHELSEAFSYGLELGHELRLGTEADFIKAWYVRPEFDWRFIKGFRFSGYVSYEHGDQGQAGQGGVVEVYDWLGLGFRLSHPITEKLSAAIRYRLTLRSSDHTSREYNQNLVGIILTYQFE